GSSSSKSSSSASNATRTTETTPSSKPSSTPQARSKPEHSSGTPAFHIVPRTLRFAEGLCALIPTSELPLNPGQTIDGCGNSSTAPAALASDYDVSDGSKGRIIIEKDSDHTLWNQQSAFLNQPDSGASAGPTVDGSSTVFLNVAGLATSTDGYFVEVGFGSPSSPAADRKALDARILHTVFNAAFSTSNG